jgi:hypothetical protein
MLKNLEVKRFLSRVAGGYHALLSYVVPAYPTIDLRTATVTTKTSDYTVTDADLKTPTIFNNSGGNGTIVFTLPSVADSKGKIVRFHSLAAQTIRVDPQDGEAINYNGSATVTEDASMAGTIGNYMEVYCDGVQWIITRSSGVITKAASSSVSPSVSPSLSPSVSPSVSPSLSPSVSPSVSPSASPS